MKTNFKWLVLGVILTSALIFPLMLKERISALFTPTSVENYAPDRIQRILDRLAVLESGSNPPNPRAINWMDKDRTASFGCLQFKITSLKMYGVRYGYLGEQVSWDWVATKLFDCDLQMQIARQMLLDPKVNKYNEWPTFWDQVKNIK